MRKDKNKLKISIVIPVYNRETLIYKCLDSIYKTDYPNFEVIVVDDGSTDNSTKTAQKFPCKIIKLKKNKGVAYARNIGAKNAKGDILYFVDSDIVQKGDTITQIASEFEKDDKLGVLAASLSREPLNKGFGPSFIALRYFYLTTLNMIREGKNKQKVTFFPSASAAIKKKVFDKTKGFDTSFKLGGEEHELGHRICKDHKIYIHKDIEVIANFKTIPKRAWTVLKRSIIHVPVFLKWRRFEKVGNIKLKETFTTFIVLLTTISFLISSLIPQLLISPLFLFSFFLILNSRLYHFIFNEKSLTFMIKGIFADFILYLSKGIGLSVGILRLFISRWSN